MTPATAPLLATCLLAGAACAGDIVGAPGAHPSDPDAATSGPLADGGSVEMPPPDAAAVFDLHPRGDWQLPSQPVTGPSLDLLALRYITIHYNGDTRDLDGADDVYQDDDYAELLRVMQSSYLETRGYSLGYNSGIAPDGDEWEIRGLDLRSAANGCTEVNVPGFAIQVTAGRAHRLRPARALIAARSFVIRFPGTPGRTASTSPCSV